MKLPNALGYGGAGVFLLAVVMGFYGMPKLINSQISGNLQLKKGSQIREMWSNFSEPVDFKVYLFNVTNPEAITRGAKPIVQEIGPYFFDEYKHKVNLKDHKEDDTLSYNPKITWFFNPSKSAPGLTGNELITIPHPLILGMVLTLARDKPGMLGLINKAIPHLHRNIPHVFVTAQAKEILFDGVLINCTVTDFSAKAVCTGIKKEGKDLKRLGENLLAFSFFGHKNGTVDETRLRVKRGINDIDELGKVVSFNGKTKMDSWRGDPCNEIKGTDSTIFPPFRDAKEDIVAFAPDLCLAMGAKLEGPAVYLGVPGSRYTADLGDMSTNEDQKCYCPKEDSCWKKGTLDLAPCQGAPIVATLPHCYMCHEDYRYSVQGFNPDKNKHEIFLTFETMTGTPMEGRKRLQFNFYVFAVPKIDLMANFPTAMLPLFWVEEGLSLEQKYIDTLDVLFTTLKVIDGVKWTLMVVGLLMAGGGAFLYSKRRKELVVSPTEPTKAPPSAVAPVTVESPNSHRY